MIKNVLVDPIDSCLRMRCECDLNLASTFSKLEARFKILKKSSTGLTIIISQLSERQRLNLKRRMEPRKSQAVGRKAFSMQK